MKLVGYQSLGTGDTNLTKHKIIGVVMYTVLLAPIKKSTEKDKIIASTYKRENFQQVVFRSIK